MIAHGWNDGAPPGQHYFGTTLNKEGVAASMGFIPSDHSYGQIMLYGQCRNTTITITTARPTEPTSPTS